MALLFRVLQQPLRFCDVGVLVLDLAVEREGDLETFSGDERAEGGAEGAGGGGGVVWRGLGDGGVGAGSG